MELLPFSASDDDLLAVAHAWLARLAESDYDAAFQLTAHDSYFGWTPDLIRRVIEGYGLPEPTRDGVVHRVSTRPGHDQARHQAVDRWPARAAEGGATSLGEVRVRRSHRARPRQGRRAQPACRTGHGGCYV